MASSEREPHRAGRIPDMLLKESRRSCSIDIPLHSGGRVPALRVSSSTPAQLSRVSMPVSNLQVGKLELTSGLFFKLGVCDYMMRDPPSPSCLSLQLPHSVAGSSQDLSTCQLGQDVCSFCRQSLCLQSLNASRTATPVQTLSFESALE